MRQNYKRLLATLVLISATQTSSVVQAEGIRLVGPSGEVQTSPSYAEEIERALPTPPENDQPSRFFGPTDGNETLWSIASQLRPSRQVSVQQTLLAIYRINPQAFENQNIHELIPGSRLRVPSLDQVQSATTAQAVAIMKAHEAKLAQAKTKPLQPKPKAEQPKPVVSPPKPVVSAPKPETPTQTVVKPQAKPEAKSLDSLSAPAETVKPIPVANTSPEGQKQVSALKDKLEVSQSEMESLEEKNHRLRLMLSEVQNEVESLKNELNDEERIRTEVEKLLEEERQRIAEQQRLQPSTMDKILSNGWLVGLAALIPGALFALLIVMLMGRRNSAKEEEAQAQAEQASQSLDPMAAPIGLAAAEELEEELSLDDDLFGDDETENLFDQEEEQKQDDVFGNLDDEDLDFNLEGDDGDDPFASIDDDGDLDVGFDEFDSSSNGIKVNGDEKALGLEEMERALDEASPELDIELGGEDSDFDLSDEDEDDDPFADLLSGDDAKESLENDTVDQAMLDDLFAEYATEDLDLDVEGQSSSTESFEQTASLDDASDDDIDKLLAEYQPSESSESDDDVFEELASLSGLSDTDSSEEDESALLDELLGEDDGASLDGLDPLEELEDISGLNEEPSIDEDSTELLDELIGFDDEDSSDDDFDPLNELEKLSGFESDDELEDIDEDSVDLLDELLSNDSSEETQSETDGGVDPFDDLIREDDEPKQSEQLEQSEQPEHLENSLSDDELLASLGFDNPESTTEIEEAQKSPPQSPGGAETSADLEDEKAALGLDSGLDIDALLSDNQPVIDEQSEIDEQAQEELPRAGTEQPDPDASDSERELESDFEPEFEPELDASLAPSEDDLVENVDVSDAQPERAIESPQVEDEAETKPEVAQEPVFTPTPNTVENEFGIPQEEDWLVDEIESESKIEQEPIAASSNESKPTEDEVFDFDELNLPEFTEDDARASMADEPALAASEMAEPQVLVDSAADEEEFDLEDLDLPEFTEDDARASMSEEPALATSEIAEPQAPVESAADEDEFDLESLDLPEFTEDDARASMSEEPALAASEIAEPQAPVESAADEDEFDLESLDLPEFTEDDARASMSEEPALAASEIAEPQVPVESAADEDEFDLEDWDLPEFSEEDALASMAEEPALTASERAEPQAQVDSAADEDEFDLEDWDLPEFNEEDALASLTDQDVKAEAEEPLTAAEPLMSSQPVIQADNDHDALFDMFAQPEAFSAEVDSKLTNDDADATLSDFEESAMANLLSEDAESEVFEGKLDSDTIASAGMDFEAMLDVGDDWDGFKLPSSNAVSAEEIPEDQRDVWGSAEALAQPQIAQENWAEQDDLTDFDPKKNQFMTIDELMAQVDQDSRDFEEQDLKLDVGLNEFPDVIGDIGDFDVDNNAEAAGKLDLAKIYLEMNDPQGAIKLLEEAIVYGEDDIRREAKRLIDSIHGR
ncbi:FimV/HubP family polar landmark protein [Vibrio alfacsensis]|uniref:FimV/HubP family polar landmark protein n=1 Tax=Vibrio alfacsensis TaxID=1074311 RepID=UPI002ADDBF71|nr:FimV/HubP family polar landmark protein [Vibrio alfacsensis]WQE75417.1 FimV/HubP family polar landmark protein [Vibrio alfacsensis]